MRKVTEDYIGTCQACFGEFKVGGDQKMVLHGFTRPGDGVTHGNCQGYDALPFEYDTTLTVQIITSYRARVEQASDRLSKLKAGAITKLSRIERQYDERHRYTGDKMIHYTPADRGWAAVLNDAIYAEERDIRWYTSSANFLQGKVDTWTRGKIVGFDSPITGKERGLRKAYDPIEAEAAEKRAAEKAAREAKPGKLRIMFFQPSITREAGEGQGFWDRREAHEAAFLKLVKGWAKGLEGKTVVRKAWDSDLPYVFRKWLTIKDLDVVVVSLPWDLRDRLETILPRCTRQVNEKKAIDYTMHAEDLSYALEHA